jgi:hypothetical protein
MHDAFFVLNKNYRTCTPSGTVLVVLRAVCASCCPFKLFFNFLLRQVSVFFMHFVKSFFSQPHPHACIIMIHTVQYSTSTVLYSIFLIVSHETTERKKKCIKKQQSIGSKNKNDDDCSIRQRTKRNERNETKRNETTIQPAQRQEVISNINTVESSRFKSIQVKPNRVE